MDLRVLVEGVIREVGGIKESTTCEEIIIKLAQASNLPGFYTLVAAYRGREDTLSADEKILHFIHNVKEKPTTIQFILRRLEAPPRPSHTRLAPTTPAGGSQLRNSGVSETNDRTRLHRSLLQKESGSTQDNLESKQLFSKAGLPRTVVEQDEYEQLEDRLAYQEREVELNRIRLCRLDKEIAELERANRANGSMESKFSGGPAAELAQLSATPWQQLLDANRARQMDLLKERERYQQALGRVTGELETSRKNTTDLETRVSDGIDRLLVTLDASIVQRRQFLRSLSPTAARTRASATKADGVPV